MLIQVSSEIFIPINRIIEISFSKESKEYKTLNVIYFDKSKSVQQVKFLENSELYKRLKTQLQRGY